jgi:uncharacterized membrane protein YqhA
MTEQESHPSTSAAEPAAHYTAKMGRAFRLTHTVIFLSIIGTTLSAITMMAYGLLVVVKIIGDALTDRPYSVENAKHLAIQLIEMTDLFLFGMALYVVAIGMVQLFIRPIPGLPRWMLVRDLGDLKTQLLNVIIVLLAVSFLAVAISWEGGTDIMYLGIGIGVVIVSLAAFSMVHHTISTHQLSREDD